MTDLTELERTKRRRLQEVYADLRPGGRKDDIRQAKLMNLLLGAAAGAGVSAGSPPPAAAAGCSGPQAIRALAAAAAASITAVERSTPVGKAGGGGSCLGRPGGGTAGTMPAGGWHRGPSGSSAAARAPPPPPRATAGGFLPENDPIQRLSRICVPLPLPPANHSNQARTPSATGPTATAAAAAVISAAAFHGSANVAVRQRYGRDYKGDDDDDVEVPSDVELALMAIRSDLRSHAASSELPPLVLRNQLSCLLVDKSSVEQQLDEQRRANRVRVFKLPTGIDEFGVLATSDYRAIVRQAADAAALSAATSAPGKVGQQQQRAPTASSPAPSVGAYGTLAAADCPGGSRWHAAAEAFLCRVVGRCTGFELSRGHLTHLLRTPPPPGESEGRRPGADGGGGGDPPDGDSTDPQTPLEVVEEQISLLLHLGCVCRHTDGDADAFVMSVPGAGKLVKAVLGGRRELLAWLSKRQHQEAPEEQIAKLKLRSSCLPPRYHLRDLEGRGSLRRIDSTCGPVIRLPRKKGTAPPALG